MYFNSSELNPMTFEQMRVKAPAIFADEPHERTSDKYLFIPTHKIIKGLTEHGWEVVSAVQSKSEGNTGKHAVMLTRPEFIKGNNMGVNDIAPMIKIENAHNGLSSFHPSGAVYRKVCANGLTVPESMFEVPKIKHTKNMANDVIEASYKVVKEFPELVERVNTLKSVELSNDEKLVLAQSASRLLFTEEQLKRVADYSRNPYKTAQDLLTARRYADRSMNDLWTVINCIQENAVRGGVRMISENERGDRRRTSTRAVKSIDTDSRINKELLTLANEMAKIKGAA